MASPSATVAHDPAAGEQLFLEGRRFREEGECAAALSKFVESYRLDPRSGTLLNIAECSLALGRTATAWAQFGKVQTLAHVQGSTDHLDYATRRITELEPKLSWLTVIAKQSLPGQRVTRDGIEMSEAQYGVKLPIDPGKHVLIVEAPGYLPREVPVTIGESADSQTIELPILIPLPARVAVQERAAAARAFGPVPSPGQHAGSSAGYGPWMLGGIGVTTLAVGGGAGILAMLDERRLARSCPSRQRCKDGDLRIQGRRDVEASTATLAIPVGAAAIGIALWWWFQRTDSADTRRKSFVTAAVGGGTSGSSIWLTGSFN